MGARIRNSVSVEGRPVGTTHLRKHAPSIPRNPAFTEARQARIARKDSQLNGLCRERCGAGLIVLVDDRISTACHHPEVLVEAIAEVPAPPDVRPVNSGGLAGLTRFAG